MVITRAAPWNELHPAAIRIPCGHCIGCRLETSRQWAVRLTHENQTSKASCFLTLTYRPETNPGQLVKDDLRKFVRRTRKHFAPLAIRYYGVGEYGDVLERPHYHMILFGTHFPDRTRWSHNSNGDNLYRSSTLEQLWPYGHSVIGEVTFESAAYVARYATKKILGAKAKDHYKGKAREFAICSLKPGIGAPWHDKYKNDTVKDGTVILRGKQMKAPRYYDTRLERTSPEQMKKIAELRTSLAAQKKDNDTRARLRVQQEVAQGRQKIRRQRLH